MLTGVIISFCLHIIIVVYVLIFSSDTNLYMLSELVTRPSKTGILFSHLGSEFLMYIKKLRMNNFVWEEFAEFMYKAFQIFV